MYVCVCVWHTHTPKTTRNTSIVVNKLRFILVATTRETMQCEKLWGISVRRCEKEFKEYGFWLGDLGEDSRK